jgi:hypothetical protein
VSTGSAAFDLGSGGAFSTVSPSIYGNLSNAVNDGINSIGAFYQASEFEAGIGLGLQATSRFGGSSLSAGGEVIIGTRVANNSSNEGLYVKFQAGYNAQHGSFQSQIEASAQRIFKPDRGIYYDQPFKIESKHTFKGTSASSKEFEAAFTYLFVKFGYKFNWNKYQKFLND